MYTPDNLPEVSLISSWKVPVWHSKRPLKKMDAIIQPLEAGVNLLDLYFLNHVDITWYADVIRQELLGNVPMDPHSFVARLTKPQLVTIAERLSGCLTEYYGGQLVGPRPRWAALATYFPNMSLPPIEENPLAKRHQAVRAVQKSLDLASLLGVHCVEVVGGAGIPSRSYRGKYDPSEYRVLRRSMLAKSLCEACLPLAQAHERQSGRHMPYLAVELEPGEAYLLNSLHEYKLLLEAIKFHLGEKENRDKYSQDARDIALQAVKLNIDVAHAFLLDLTPEMLRQNEMENHVAHMHLSDHAGHKEAGGAHTSDLPPSTFHHFTDYEPWLQFAIKKTRERGTFSGVIAMEMEACDDLDSVLNAIHVTRRWLIEAATNMPTPPGASILLPEGVIVALDIGNSSEAFFGDQQDVVNCRKLEEVVSQLCTEVHNFRGSVMSFTGDGYIAFFNTAHFTTPTVAAHQALKAVQASYGRLQAVGLTGRAACHWGAVYIPVGGSLKNQIIGGPVVVAARACDWLAHLREPAQPEEERGREIVITEEFYEYLEPVEQGRWSLWGGWDPKGMPSKNRLFLHLTD